MGKIVLLAQGEHIRKQAEKLKSTLKDKDNLEIRVAHMDVAVEYARGMDKKEVDVLIARGDTARLMKQSNLPFPVIDIGITDESIVGSIIAAEEISGTENPSIGIIGLESFVARVRSFFNILRPKVVLYTAKDRKNVQAMVAKAKEDGIDVVIGGDLTCRLAKAAGMKCVMTGTTYELVEAAYNSAVDLQRSIEAERKKNEEINTIFNTVTDGIVSLNEDGAVTTMNRRAEAILDRTGGKQGVLTMDTVFGAEKSRLIREVMDTGRENTGIAISFGNRAYAMNVVPVQVDGKNKGCAVTLSSVHELQKMETKIRRGMYLKGNTADYTFDDIQGRSENLKEAVRLAETFAPLQSNVLIIGQTGTGKEMFAQSIHNESDRKDGPFVAVNCGSIPDSLIESELFGYVDGAFTGAKKGGKMGLFELAHNGTIFLDEISEMSLQGQVRLLRVIQEQQVRRVGSDTVIPVNVRIIAACNTNLKQMVAEQRFRKDLYYRLSVLVLQLPELRRRQGDVGLLAEFFIKGYNQKFSKQVRLSEEAKEAMEQLEWDGNIRQLRNFCERISAVCPDGEADADFIYENYRSSYSFDQLDMSPAAEGRKDGSSGSREPLAGSKKKVSEEQLRELMKKYKGSRTKAAAELQISRTTLWKYLKELGLDDK
ncbi:sigma 54-interacting transcriptional regulator [Clostridium sp. AM58-1XD]|uniref:sigma 54-interacting transcriptional regulator n=1 Tax=Clostridium sp. AM58-1XD TaxID=2292307 RepID=UPI000E4CCFF5|nr:sigma 54-interacting transcriptional regulator [Clostridium sp. AM58-1XD]RGZ00399.1 AAA family ATPase [Clostridium sp. AM58-1XD]